MPQIKTGGSLKRVGRSPCSSTGTSPVSIAVYGHLVYVANAGTAGSAGGTNYTGFTLNRPTANSRLRFFRAGACQRLHALRSIVVGSDGAG